MKIISEAHIQIFYVRAKFHGEITFVVLCAKKTNQNWFCLFAQSTTNVVSQGQITVQAGDTLSVVADLTSIPTSAVIGFATVTMELI